MGVVDAIADGCWAVVRRPWVILPVVLLDLLYWVSGRLTAAPLTNGLIRLLELAQQQSPSGPDPADSIRLLRTLGQSTDLLELLSIGQRPLLQVVETDLINRPWGAGVLDLQHWWLICLLVPVLTVAGLFWLACALSLLATLVGEQPFSVRQVCICWLRLLGLAGVILAGLFMIFMPLLIVSTLLSLLGLGVIAMFLFFLLPMVLLYLYFFLSFAPEAIVLNQVGPLRAIKQSVQMVRRNFWSALGLVGATHLIGLGLPYGWQLLTPQVVGVPLAIIGNGLIVSGFAVGALLFFQARTQVALSSAVEQAGTNPG